MLLSLISQVSRLSLSTVAGRFAMRWGVLLSPRGTGSSFGEVKATDSLHFSLRLQLRIGMDLHRVTLPVSFIHLSKRSDPVPLLKRSAQVFVLEPRSMLERITDFLSHPDLIFGSVPISSPSTGFSLDVDVVRWYMYRTGKEEDPEKRFVQVLRYYLAGWHIKPKGVCRKIFQI